MSKHGQLFYDFGPFRLDPANYLLTREGRHVTLTRKAAEMLTVLVENRGEVLDKEALLRRLWPDTTVEESNLTQNVYMIRQALGEVAQQQHAYIETIPKRGYRFVAQVTEVRPNGHGPSLHELPPGPLAHAPDEETHAPAPDATGATLTGPTSTGANARDTTTTDASAHDTAAPSAAAPDATAPVAATSSNAAHGARASGELHDSLAPPPPDAEVHRTLPPAAFEDASRPEQAPHAPARAARVSTRSLVVALLSLALVVAAVYFWAKGRAGSAGARSVAVLPLKAIGSDAEAAHLGLGMTDAMITKLSNLQQISVRPTSAIFRYTNGEYDPVKAGRELGVDAVVEGSVQRAGDSVRVTVRLLSVPEGRPLWGEIFDRKASDVFAVQDAVSEEVAQALQLKLTSAERTQLSKHYTQSPEAYQAYARGLYFWNQRTEEGFRQAVRNFEEAIAKDQSYALAYAGLSDSYGLVAYYRYERVAPRDEALNRARAAAERAVALDDTLAEGHAALGLARSLARDLTGAAESYRRAVALNPNYPTARQRFALTLLSEGQLEEAVAEMERAQSVDPVSSVINTNLAQMHYFRRDYDRAATLAEKALETAPTGTGTNRLMMLFLLGNTRAQQGRLEEARSLYRQALEQNPEFDEAREGLAHTAALAGRREEALSYFPRFRELSREFPQAFLSLALVHAALGERDAAFHNLALYARAQPYPPPSLRFDPRLDPLRSDPRFDELLKRR
jgi:DNA-binding winged helix-turn-helix (wHTH) protein/TolB-like protein/Flp pilus assembly protein TadD